MTQKIAFLASPHPEAQQAKKAFEALYPSVPVKNADVLVVLGGDGFMLETMHACLKASHPHTPHPQPGCEAHESGEPGGRVGPDEGLLKNSSPEQKLPSSDVTQRDLESLCQRRGGMTGGGKDEIHPLSSKTGPLNTVLPPLYGINYGSVGFLMNECPPSQLLDHLKEAKPTELYPLEMTALTEDGEKVTALAFNEVSCLRQTHQAAKIQIHIDGIERLAELICDGVLVATPAGSTAYNLSAHGPILPLNSALLALTPISAFRPRRWKGALLPEDAQATFTILEPHKRPVSAVADFTEVRNVREISIRQIKTTPLTLLFNQDHNLEERILREQFLS